MSEECTHNCSSCSQECGSREQADLKAPLSAGSTVRHVIAVMSGKGGVGKSMVTSLLTAAVQKCGKRTAVLDADITGPSIPHTFGVDGMSLMADKDGVILPCTSAGGTQIVSANLLLENDTDPIIWRGSLIANAVRQFWSETGWKDVDYMFVDMPPGTGDVPLTVFQSLPVEGILIVTSPQELVSMIVQKAVIMAEKMHIPVLGLIENMSYLECPDCHRRISVFGESTAEETAARYNIPLLARIPIDHSIAEAMDKGAVESLEAPYLKEAVKAVLGD